jgi:diguanylate cyclase (GGDEF)-like protein/PAS domain S-box-containing protein
MDVQPIEQHTGSTEKRRQYSFVITAAILIPLYWFFRDSPWQSDAHVHTLMELAATLLALMIGISALIRYYAKPNETLFLFIGAGFLGTGFLDGYHGVVTSVYFAHFYPSPPESLIPWSWIASRFYLSVFLFWAYLQWRKENGVSSLLSVRPKIVYAITIITTTASFIFFATVPLPDAYYSDLFFHRPEELLPALFFALALIGFYSKGEWKTSCFEFWLVMALVVSLISQAVFMSFSERLFDYEFDVAHLLKKASYIAVLTGIYISMLKSFQKEVTLSETLQEQKKQFETIYQTSKDGLAVLDLETNFIDFNDAYLELTGYTREELLKQSSIGMCVPEDIPKSREAIAEVLEKGFVRNFEKSSLRKDGTVVIVDMSIALMPDGKHLLVSTKDITEHKRLMENLDRQHTYLQNIIDGMYDTLMVIDKEHNILLMNEAARAMIDEKSLKGTQHLKCFEVLHKVSEPCDSDNHLCPLQAVIESKTSQTTIHRHYDKENNERLIEVSVTPLFDGEGEIYAFIESGHDVTELMTVRSELDRQINYDSLTSLPNYRLFMDRLNEFIKRSTREKGQAAVMLIDIDRLKEINDSLGHKAGDIVIKGFAEWLMGCVREQDTVARFSGNTFGVLLEEIEDDLAPVRVLESLNKIVGSDSIKIADHDIHITFSGGITLFPDDGANADTLYKNADAALYAAKDAGRNTYRYYTNEMTDKAFERVMMDSNLRDALKNEEFTLHYQPQFDARNDAVIGMEALIRWNHASMGLIPPGRFIPILESSNLMIDVGAWIFKTAFSQVVGWREAGLSPGIVSVNLSMVQLREGDRLIDTITALLEETGCRAEWIGMEITESMTMDNPESVIKILKTLSELGFQISLDDFGTGYSSLAYLKKLPLNKLKLDKSFIDDLPDNIEDVTLSRTIIALAENLGMEIIAEGVETQGQKQFLVENGCHEIQGFFYSKPLIREQMEAMLQDRKG